ADASRPAGHQRDPAGQINAHRRLFIDSPRTAGPQPRVFQRSVLPAGLPDHQRRALAEEAERDHERAAERRLGGERIPGADPAKPVISPWIPAQRARACSAASRTRRPAPSPAVSPAESQSSAAISPAPQYVAKKSSSSWASAPPQRATSRSPSPMSRYASPTARAPPIGPSVIARQNPWASWAMAT